MARAAPADEPEIVSDRPGFGESASVVGSGRVQVETGGTWTRSDSSTSVVDLPEGLVRFGLGRSLELRVTAPGWVWAHGASGAGSGWSDAALGLRGHIAAGQGDLALRGTVYVPTGRESQSAEGPEPEVALAWSRALPAHWSFGATLSVRRLRLLHENLTSPSVSLGHPLGAHVATFVEYGANLAREDHAVHKLDHGYTWIVNPHTQLDAALGVGLSAAGPSFFAGLGFSRRF